MDVVFVTCRTYDSFFRCEYVELFVSVDLGDRYETVYKTTLN